MGSQPPQTIYLPRVHAVLSRKTSPDDTYESEKDGRIGFVLPLHKMLSLIGERENETELLLGNNSIWKTNNVDP